MGVDPETQQLTQSMWFENSLSHSNYHVCLCNQGLPAQSATQGSNSQPPIHRMGAQEKFY